MKVNINGAGHQVEIECDSPDLGYVIEKAQKLYEETKPDKAGPGYAGFQMERDHRYGGVADMRLGERPTIEGNAA